MSTKKKTKIPFLKVLGGMGMALCLVGFLSAATPFSQELGVDACADCHEDVAKAFMTNPHITNNSCTPCHGDATEHMEEGGGPNIFAFSSEDIYSDKANMCLSCHMNSNARYFASPHAKAAMDCTECHSIHGNGKEPFMLKVKETKTCYTCHEDIFSQFQLNERHRLQEGIMKCSTCHDPHEASPRERLGGFKHEACIQCHTDKGGPFFYEHDASRIEGCRACHEVHGSPNRHMLRFQSIADLCFSCHGAAPSWHSRFDSYSSNCTTCHSTIHGSNLDKIFLK